MDDVTIGEAHAHPIRLVQCQRCFWLADDTGLQAPILGQAQKKAMRLFSGKRLDAITVAKALGQASNHRRNAAPCPGRTGKQRQHGQQGITGRERRQAWQP